MNANQIKRRGRDLKYEQEDVRQALKRAEIVARFPIINWSLIIQTIIGFGCGFLLVYAPAVSDMSGNTPTIVSLLGVFTLTLGGWVLFKAFHHANSVNLARNEVVRLRKRKNDLDDELDNLRIQYNKIKAK